MRVVLHAFILLLLPQMSSGEERACSSSYIQKGFQLQGHTLKKLSATSRSACMRECKLHSKCYSINYHYSKKSCELNDANHLADAEKLTLSQGYEYSNNDARSPLSCSTKYCSRKTDKCVIDRNGRGYKCLSCKDEGGQDVMAFPQPNIQNKVVLENWFESLNAYTVCSWNQLVSKSDQALFSYATSGNPNEIFVYIMSGKLLALSLGTTDVDGQTDYPADGGWHQICLTWENNLGNWQMYIDGVMKKNGTKNAGRVIDKGAVVLGQDQDSYKGGFAVSQSYQGNLTNVNLWNRVLTAQEVLDLSRSCSNGEGNVIKWSDFLDKEEGDIQLLCSDDCSGV